MSRYHSREQQPRGEGAGGAASRPRGAEAARDAGASGGAAASQPRGGEAARDAGASGGAAASQPRGAEAARDAGATRHPRGHEDAGAHPLAGRVALVAGATRGAGRAIAIELGAAGAIVYATGRSTRGNPSPMARAETIEETAELVDAAGGTGIAVRVDHTRSAEVAALVARIANEQDGRLDVLINDIWGGDPLTEWRPFWEHDLANGLEIQRTGVHTHLVTSWHAVPLMIARGRGLVVEITDGVDERYRGSLYYDLAKSGVIRLAHAQAEELRPHGIAAVAVSPGFLRSEAMLDHFGVTEATWRDAIAADRHFAASETPRFVARGIAALAADPQVMVKSGQALGSWHLGREYGVRDVDGSRPDWGEHFEREVLPELG